VDVIRSGALGDVNRMQAEKLEAISNNIKRLDKLVGEILDLSRIDSGELKLSWKSTDLSRIAEKVVEELRVIAGEKVVNLEFRKSRTNVRARVDADRIRRVLLNLIDNSLKFTPIGGNIVVSVGKNKKYAILKVQDTGVGIPRKHVDKVFDRFYQADSSARREYEGFGLGLSICKKIIEMHGGIIQVKSKVNKGTTVIVKIPL